MEQVETGHIDGNNRLVRANDFTSASYTLTTDAHRILSVAISLIKQRDS